MATSPAQAAATARYQKKAYDKVLLRLKKGQRGVISTYAAARGETLNGYVTRLINEDMSSQDDTDYLASIPGMSDKIKAGMNTPLSECVPLSEVWEDV